MRSTRTLPPILFKIYFFIIYYLAVNGFLPGGSGTTIIHNTQMTHITQNNTPRSNETQHTKLRHLGAGAGVRR
jgi:hypothetical protein